MPKDAREADKAGKQFYATTARVASDLNSDMDVLHTVARGAALKQWQLDISTFRGQKRRLVGTPTVTLVAAKAGSDAKEWKLRYCWDLSKTDFLDASGKSVRGKGPKRLLEDVVVTQDVASGDWFVTEEEAIGTC